MEGMKQIWESHESEALLEAPIDGFINANPPRKMNIDLFSPSIIHSILPGHHTFSPRSPFNQQISKPVNSNSIDSPSD
jgi:hypothetical protein